MAREPARPDACRVRRLDTGPDAATADEQVAVAHETSETLRHRLVAIRTLARAARIATTRGRSDRNTIV